MLLHNLAPPWPQSWPAGVRMFCGLSNCSSISRGSETISCQRASIIHCTLKSIEVHVAAQCKLFAWLKVLCREDFLTLLRVRCLEN